MTATDEITGRLGARFLPVDKMWQRVEIAKGESDTAYFHDLMYLGELLAKVTVSAVVAAIEDDRERTRYKHTHALVRAAGLGEWDSAAAEALTGPTAQHFVAQSQIIIQDLTQQMGLGSWQH